MIRSDGRAPDQLRPVHIVPDFQSFPEGSALIEVGLTRVVCAVSVEDRVPQFLRGTGRGWITAEYSMLPRSTPTRTPREAATGRISGRTHEIQRLIGRSLRAIADLSVLGERTLTVDCDVLQADGGTRTAAITGAYVALAKACRRLQDKGDLSAFPLQSSVAAVSVGIVDGVELLDLCYEEDVRAEVDFNVVMTSQQQFVEIQGTAEHKPFSKAAADRLLALAKKGILELFELQERSLSA